MIPTTVPMPVFKRTRWCAEDTINLLNCKEIKIKPSFCQNLFFFGKTLFIWGALKDKKNEFSHQLMCENFRAIYTFFVKRCGGQLKCLETYHVFLKLWYSFTSSNCMQKTFVPWKWRFSKCLLYLMHFKRNFPAK